jgi:hypothetical protein
MCFFASCFLHQVGVLHQPYDLKCAGVDLGEDCDGIRAPKPIKDGTTGWSITEGGAAPGWWITAAHARMW